MMEHSFLEESRRLIAESIESQCQVLIDNYKDIPGVHKYAEMLCEYTLRGKLLRGTLLRLSAHSFGEGREDQILSCAVALELAQSAFLIHDDIMDGDTLRRGKASLHTVIGENQAICLGDLALIHSFSLTAPYPHVAMIFARHLGATALGQAYEIRSTEKQAEFTIDEIYHIIQNKTSRYTFVLPLEAGAALVNVSDENLSALGQAMGVIFQVRDDELNILYSEQTGKSIGGDIRENKKTLCRSVLLKHHPEAVEYFGHEGNVEVIRQLYQQSGAAKEVAEFIDRHNERVKYILDSLFIKKETRPIWDGLLEFLNGRNY